MDLSGMEEEDGVRPRSFRYEDYNNRRAFLRSYPLLWEVDGEEEDVLRISKVGKRRTKGRFPSIFQWSRGGKIPLLKRLKDKVATFYVVACRTFGFNQSNSLLSV